MRKSLFVELSAVAVTLILAACGGSPSGPSNTPDFTGVWQGNWQRTSCSGPACDAVPPSGVLRLTLTQAGNEVQGTVEVDSLLIAASGVVTSGALALTGSARVQDTTARLSNWSTTRSDTTMNGGFTLTLTPDNPQIGAQVVQVSLQNVTKRS